MLLGTQLRHARVEMLVLWATVQWAEEKEAGGQEMPAIQRLIRRMGSNTGHVMTGFSACGVGERS